MSIETIQDLSKNFTPDEEMQGVLDRSQQMFSEERWNSLEILEEIHKHRHQLKEPFTSFEPVLGGKPGGFTYQAFLHISKGLDTPASFDLEHTKSQRQKLVGRLELLLKDGAAEAFRIHSRSLHLAVLLRNKELLQRLLDEGQNPDESWPISGWTALHLATQENRKDLVDALLKAETKANTKDKFGHTPLSYASKGGHSEIERLIRERSRRVQSNAAYEAMQINSPINPFDEHLIIEGNTAYDASLQVNYPIAQDVFRRILEARDVRRQ
jgi:ankyrin repeat protein